MRANVPPEPTAQTPPASPMKRRGAAEGSRRNRRARADCSAPREESGSINVLGDHAFHAGEESYRAL